MNEWPRLLMYWSGGYERAGGIGRFVGSLIDASHAAKRPYEIVTLDTRGPYSIYVSPIFFAWTLGRTVVAAMSHRPTAAHVNICHKGSTIRKVIVCKALAALRIPYVLHLHANNYDTYFDRQPAWGRALIRRTFADAKEVVVLGTLWHEITTGRLGVDPAKILTIRNGVPDPGVRLPPDQDPQPLILFLSNLLPWKGLSELIQALGSPALRAMPWRLICAGEGKQSGYQAEADQAGIGDRVQFTGWVSRDRAQSLLREASILALPSHIEGLSVTLIEGLAQGVPVVATPVGAHPDILRDGENAVVVPPADVDALAKGLHSLLADPALAARIGAGGRALFEECLEIGGIEVEFHEIYQRLLRRPYPGRDAQPNGLVRNHNGKSQVAH